MYLFVNIMRNQFKMLDEDFKIGQCQARRLISRRTAFVNMDSVVGEILL